MTSSFCALAACLPLEKEAQKFSCVVYTFLEAVAGIFQTTAANAHRLTKVLYRAPDGALDKCTMCFDRQQANMIPACVQSCPTGAMLFGERSAILSEAKARVAALKIVYLKAQAIDADSVRVVFIVADEPHKYYKYAAG